MKLFIGESPSLSRRPPHPPLLRLLHGIQCASAEVAATVGRVDYQTIQRTADLSCLAVHMVSRISPLPPPPLPHRRYPAMQLSVPCPHR